MSPLKRDSSEILTVYSRRILLSTKLKKRSNFLSPLNQAVSLIIFTSLIESESI